MQMWGFGDAAALPVVATATTGSSTGVILAVIGLGGVALLLWAGSKQHKKRKRTAYAKRLKDEGWEYKPHPGRARRVVDWED
jgi:hypothetical protein